MPQPVAESGDLSRNRRRALRWGIIGLAVIVALIAWLASRGGGSSTSSSPEDTGTQIVSTAQLREAVAELDQPVYWAGRIAGKELELRGLGTGGGVQVVYVPRGVEAGKGSLKSLTIGSYPLPDPAAAIEVVASRPGAIVRHGDGREVVSSESSPTSAYFADPDNKVQVEVFDRSPRRAMKLALSARTRPVR